MKREDLLHALEIVRPGLASKEMIAQSTSFAFIDDRVVTYNDEISISHPVAGLGTKMRGAVRAEELYQLLSRIKKDDIVLEQGDKEVTLKAGKAKAGIVMEARIKLPLDDISKPDKWKPLPADFVTGVEFAVPSCAKDTSRPVLMCVNVRKDGFVEATDNFRITRHKIGEMPVTFLLPAGTARELVRYPITKVASGKGWVHFKTDTDTIFSCRIYQGEFPDISSILKVVGTEVELPVTMTDVLDRAAVFAQQETKDENVTIVLDEGKMTIKGKNPFGWFEEAINMPYEGDGFEFAINPAFLKTIAGQIRKCVVGKRCLKFTGPTWEHVVALTAMET
jgi:DNA polymerase III sliding clamp (beta) subunit (PCNA family)